jgi:hypothetical protein
VQGEVGEADRDEISAVEVIAAGSDDVQGMQVVLLGEPVGAKVDGFVAGEFEEPGGDARRLADQGVEIVAEVVGDLRVVLAGTVCVVDVAEFLERPACPPCDLAVAAQRTSVRCGGK